MLRVLCSSAVCRDDCLMLPPHLTVVSLPAPPSTTSAFSHHTLSSSPQHLSRCKSCNISLRKVPSSSGRDSRVTRGLHHSHHHPCCSSIVSSSAHWMRCQAGDQLFLMLVAGVRGALPLTPNTEPFTEIHQFCLVSKDPSNH